MELMIILGVIIAIEGAVIMTVLGIKALGGVERKPEEPTRREELVDKWHEEREKEISDALRAIQGYDYNTARKAVSRYDGAEDEE